MHEIIDQSKLKEFETLISMGAYVFYHEGEERDEWLWECDKINCTQCFMDDHNHPCSDYFGNLLDIVYAQKIHPEWFV